MAVEFGESTSSSSHNPNLLFFKDCTMSRFFRVAAVAASIACVSAFVPARPAARAVRAPTVARSAGGGDVVPQMSPKGIVVTGGAGGVGYAYVEEFVRNGHSVVFCDINEKMLAEAEETIKAKYPKVGPSVDLSLDLGQYFPKSAAVGRVSALAQRSPTPPRVP